MKSPVRFSIPNQPISQSNHKRYSQLWVLPAMALLVSPMMQSSAHAFAGEDPLLGHPWHHEELTELATVEGKFSHTLSSEKAYKDKSPAEREDNPRPEAFQAAEIVGWNADYVDSYLYSPIWWAQGGFDRFKISLATAPDLERVHFDDLFDSDKVRFMWRRYTTGTVAGILWAKDQTGADGRKGDVAAAQNILGVSLHAMQDFYSHSNWIDDPARRDKTFFEIEPSKRPSLSLFTGAYEHDENLGVKSHGKFLYKSAIWNQPGVKQLMDVACGPGSPIGNDPMCREYHESEGAIDVQPNVGGVKLPPNVLFVHPGINVDNLWSAEIGVKERGLTDITGQQALDTALTLAQRQSLQWLTTIEKAMVKAGPEAVAFWNRLKTEAPPEAERHAQFEDYSKFPYQFLSTGPYPPEVNNAPEYYLRLKIKTGDSANAGTDADIRLKVDGAEKPFLLDYTPGKNFILAHNDFEKGAEAVYSVGPFKTLPKSVTFFNDSATNWDVIKAAGKKYLESIIAPIKTIGNILGTISGKDADWIQTNHQVWMPDQLAALGSEPETFHIPLDGGDRGHYEVSGTIAKTGEDSDGLHIKLHLHKLFCITESKWDRGSNSDEPFLLAVPMSLPGASTPFKTEPYDDVDKGETRDINADFDLTVPRDYGMVNLPLSLMEHDDESSKKRQELLDAFAGNIKGDDNDERGFLNTIGAAVAEDWQLGHLEVTAWTRNGPVNVGTVHDSDINQWVKGRKEYTVNFNNPGGLKPYPITPDDLLPYFPPGSSQPEQPTTPTDPGTTTDPTTPTDPATPSVPSSVQLALMDKFAGKWRTPWGVLTLVRDGSAMKGVYRRANPMTHIEGDAETVVLGPSREANSIEGQVKFGTMAMGTLFLTLGVDNDTFTGNFQHNGDNEHPGQRIKDTPATPTDSTTTPPVPTVPTVPTTPTSPTVPTVPTVPVSTVPTVPTTPTIPTTPTVPNLPTSPSTGGGFRPLGGWSVQIDSMRVARGSDVEVTASYKNISRQRAGLTASDVSMVLTDSDGVGIRNNGNLYRAGGDPDMEPDKMSRDPQVDPGGVIRLLSLFTIPRTETPLKTLAIFGYRCKPLTFDVSGLTLPEPVVAVHLPINGAVGGSNAFSDFDDYNVRFDGIRKGRNDTLQVFVTVKNMSKDAFKSHPGTDLDVSILDQDGIAIPDNGTVYRASGDSLEPEKIDHTITLVPNATATVCYTVTLPKGAQPKQLLVKYYNDRKLLVTLPSIP
ncbi:hypothetical protein IAD21_05269 [Abditibacteriota bacterium]|nr:hypothetical protein IAD21_05269 [Abditibacteriota bacterium]